MTTELRRELLADHARRRVGAGAGGEGWTDGHLRSRTCGDEVTVHVHLEGGIVTALAWEGIGCEISTASASMLAELLPGTREDEVPAVIARIGNLVRGPEDAADDPANDDLGDATALAGIGRLPLRGNCALLPWRALGAALDPSL